MDYPPFEQLEDVPVNRRRDPRFPRLKFQPRHVQIEGLPEEKRVYVRNVIVFVQDTGEKALDKLKEFSDTQSCPIEGSRRLLRDGTHILPLSSARSQD